MPALQNQKSINGHTPLFSRGIDHQPLWDIFCHIVDNYGDIGVSWRLARQLHDDFGFRVRLFVDDLASFERLCPQIDPDRGEQQVEAVNIIRWHEHIIASPGDVVIETFACHLPEKYVVAMAKKKEAPVWINLDYLSAEKWIGDCHALPSPHLRLPLTKYFFFPGFDAKTGGLLRESSLFADRDTFLAADSGIEAFRTALGLPPIFGSALKISLFAYENPALNELLNIWAKGDRPIYCLVAGEKSFPSIAGFSGKVPAINEEQQHGSLTLKRLPFLTQPEYDRLLWYCDINFVRGEDSFVRAQWAARPMLWHIYPQERKMHLVKLDAFLDRYCAGCGKEMAATIRTLHQSWNRGMLHGQEWGSWLAHLPAICQHAKYWAEQLGKQEDLCTRLVKFYLSKL